MTACPYSLGRYECHERCTCKWKALESELAELRKENERLRARVGEEQDNRNWVATERDAYRSMLCDLLASAHPHPVEHPTMTRQWARARELLKNGPRAPGSDSRGGG